mmetsp:Transcript_35064/g.71752  ORF Transcript_35064/g.71752 Transcript_35064/m.71752 type:complete len:136 (-) Transcript_35064:118-525(-)
MRGRGREEDGKKGRGRRRDCDDGLEVACNDGAGNGCVSAATTAAAAAAIAGRSSCLAVGFDYPTPGFDGGRGGGSGSGDSDGGIRGGAAEKDLLGSLVRGPLACLPTIQRRRSLRRGDRSGRQVWVRRLHRVHLR